MQLETLISDGRGIPVGGNASGGSYVRYRYSSVCSKTLTCCLKRHPQSNQQSWCIAVPHLQLFDLDWASLWHTLRVTALYYKIYQRTLTFRENNRGHTVTIW